MSVPAKTIRRFTPQQKAEAVELCLQEGLCCNVMAQRLGLPSSSLARWVSQARIASAQDGPKDQVLVSSEEWAALNPAPFVESQAQEGQGLFRLEPAHVAL